MIASYDVGSEKFVSSLAWGIDDESIYFARGATWHADDSEIVRVHLETGDVTVIDQGGRLAVDPPDGKLAYWTDRNGDGMANALSVTSPDGSNKVEVVSEPSSEVASQSRFPVWSPDGTVLAYRVGSGGASQNWYIYDARSGGSQSPLALNVPTGVGSGGMIWSPDSSRLFVSAGDTAWVVTQTGEQLAKAKFSFDPARGWTWSPDGTRISTTSRNKNAANVWDISTGDVTAYAPLEGYIARTGPVWSPDGRAFVWMAKDGSARSYEDRVIIEAPPKP